MVELFLIKHKSFLKDAFLTKKLSCYEKYVQMRTIYNKLFIKLNNLKVDMMINTEIFEQIQFDNKFTHKSYDCKNINVLTKNSFNIYNKQI